MDKATMTTQREWPNNARNARDHAAEEIVRSLRMTWELIENGGYLTTDDRVRLLSLALHHQQNALRWLESVGAPTHPVSLDS